MNREQQCEIEAAGYMVAIRRKLCLASGLEGGADDALVREVDAMAAIAKGRLDERDQLRAERLGEEQPPANGLGA